METVESWADRNGLTYGTARAWAMKGVLPTVKLGKRLMLNSALLRSWLLELSGAVLGCAQASAPENANMRPG